MTNDKLPMNNEEATVQRFGFIVVADAEQPANAPAYMRLGSFAKLDNDAAAVFWLSEVEQSLN